MSDVPWLSDRRARGYDLDLGLFFIFAGLEWASLLSCGQREIKGGNKVQQAGIKIKNGGSAWESNPPGTVLAPHNGFEDREPHQIAARFQIMNVVTYNIKFKSSQSCNKIKSVLIVVSAGLDHRFGQFPSAGRPRQGVFGRAAGCLSDSEFLPVWKKYPGVAGTMIRAFQPHGL
jgi:hypothetical protein